MADETSDEQTDEKPKPARQRSRGPTPVNIRNFSVKCGRCEQYQVIVAFEPDEDCNRYTYECEWPPCDEDRSLSRTFVEVPIDLDEFANRDPNWRGGRIHAGAELDEDTDDASETPPGLPIVK